MNEYVKYLLEEDFEIKQSYFNQNTYYIWHHENSIIIRFEEKLKKYYIDVLDLWVNELSVKSIKKELKKKYN